MINGLKRREDITLELLENMALNFKFYSINLQTIKSRKFAHFMDQLLKKARQKPSIYTKKWVNYKSEIDGAFIPCLSVFITEKSYLRLKKS